MGTLKVLSGCNVFHTFACLHGAHSEHCKCALQAKLEREPPHTRTVRESHRRRTLHHMAELKEELLAGKVTPAGI